MGLQVWHVGQRRALLARAEAWMAAAVIGSRRQPMVPIALVSGHSGSVFIASNHAACSHLELGLAPCGGGS